MDADDGTTRRGRTARQHLGVRWLDTALDTPLMEQQDSLRPVKIETFTGIKSSVEPE